MHFYKHYFKLIHGKINELETVLERIKAFFFSFKSFKETYVLVKFTKSGSWTINLVIF